MEIHGEFNGSNFRFPFVYSGDFERLWRLMEAFGNISKVFESIRKHLEGLPKILESKLPNGRAWAELEHWKVPIITAAIHLKLFSILIFDTIFGALNYLHCELLASRTKSPPRREWDSFHESSYRIQLQNQAKEPRQRTQWENSGAFRRVRFCIPQWKQCEPRSVRESRSMLEFVAQSECLYFETNLAKKSVLSSAPLAMHFTHCRQSVLEEKRAIFRRPGSVRSVRVSCRYCTGKL